MGTETSAHIVVTEIRMPFWSMLVFMIKWAIAAISTFIILAVLGGVVAARLSGFAIIIGMGR